MTTNLEEEVNAYYDDDDLNNFENQGFNQKEISFPNMVMCRPIVFWNTGDDPGRLTIPGSALTSLITTTPTDFEQPIVIPNFPDISGSMPWNTRFQMNINEFLKYVFTGVNQSDVRKSQMIYWIELVLNNHAHINDDGVVIYSPGSGTRSLQPREKTLLVALQYALYYSMKDEQFVTEELLYALQINVSKRVCAGVTGLALSMANVTDGTNMMRAGIGDLTGYIHSCNLWRLLTSFSIDTEEVNGLLRMACVLHGDKIVLPSEDSSVAYTPMDFDYIYPPNTNQVDDEITVYSSNIDPLAQKCFALFVYFSDRGGFQR